MIELGKVSLVLKFCSKLPNLLIFLFWGLASGVFSTEKGEQKFILFEKLSNASQCQRPILEFLKKNQNAINNQISTVLTQAIQASVLQNLSADNFQEKYNQILKGAENNILKLITEDSSFLNPKNIQLFNKGCGFCCLKKKAKRIKDEIVRESFEYLLIEYLKKNVQCFVSEKGDIRRCLEGTFLREIKSCENGKVILGDEVDCQRIFEFLKMFFPKSFVSNLQDWIIDNIFFKNNLLSKIEDQPKTIEGPKINYEYLPGKNKNFTAVLEFLEITSYKENSPLSFIAFPSLNQKNLPLSGFFIKYSSLFFQYGFQYWGLKDKCFDGDQRLSCFFLEEYYPEFWSQTLKNVLGLAYGFSMGGHPALKYALLYRRPCFLINPASSISIFKKSHHAGKDFNFLPLEDLETRPYLGAFHPVYWIFSQKSSFDVKTLQSELSAPHLNTLYFFHPFESENHVDIKAKKPEELILLLHKLNNFSTQGDQEVLEGAHQKVVILDDWQESLLKQVELTIAERKKVIIKNTTIDPDFLKEKGFSIAYIFDRELTPTDIKNIAKGTLLLLKQKEITQEGLNFCQNALLGIDLIDIEEKPAPHRDYYYFPW